MINFILIGFCITLGYVFKTYHVAPPDAHKGINTWIINVGLPAVALKYIPHIVWSWEVLLPALGPALVWIGGNIYTYFYAKKNLFHTPSQASMTLTSSLSNTSFVGFPLIMAYFGEKYLSIAIICDQMTFFLFATVGLICAVSASKLGGTTVQPKAIIKRLFAFPPFMGTLLGLSLPHFVNLSPAEPLFNSLAATVSPLALFSVGLQLKFSGWQSELKHISAALIYKLMLAPALIFAVIKILGLGGDTARITVFEMAMPTLISSSIMIEQYQLNTKLANLVIGIGIVISMLTTGFWYFIIQTFL